MYVCICHRVRESEVRSVIRAGAETEETVGDACGAGTNCGSCLDRICDMIDEEARQAHTRRLLAA
jgi:bacterioferritin-associated ferredoxin